MEESLMEPSGDFEHAFDEADDGGFDEREVEYFEDENDLQKLGNYVFARIIRSILPIHIF